MSSVSVTVPQSSLVEQTTSRPTHHANDSKTAFVNPWPSFRWELLDMNAFSAAFLVFRNISRPTIPPNIAKLVGSRTPDWGANADPRKIKTTWLGHACSLVELPSPPGARRGPRILFDPVFSARCSPSQWIGPKRYTNPPCTLSEIPEVDVIAYSHDHYDHLDKPTLVDLLARNSSAPRIHVFAGLNNDPLFKSISIPSSHYHCLDWWDSRDVTVSLPPASDTAEPVPCSFRITCTPSQHNSGRGIGDRFTTLWCSWAIEADISTKTESEAGAVGDGAKVWFAGDTGYRSIVKGEEEKAAELPVCPAFREIGEKFGGFDLALIPIGAYEPRFLFSPVHCSPDDSVDIFRDVRARKAIGVHWGTWVLTSEPPMAPVERLAEARKKAGISQDDFGVCELGETVVV